MLSPRANASSSRASTVPRRRNGRPQACEPCRGRKVACDHLLPVCSRCRRGQIEHKCVYLVSKSGPSPTPNASRERAAKLSSPDRAAAARIVSPRTAHQGTNSDETLPSESVRYEALGYMGATSFSTDLEEAQRRLRSMRGAERYADLPPHQDDRSHTFRDFKPPKAAIEALRSIPDRSSSYFLFESYRNIHDSWCRLAARWLLDSLWASFGDILEGDRSDKSLSAMAKTLCLNTTTVLREDHTDPMEWFREFSGGNMRWESLGILFSHWSSGLLSLPRETFRGSCTALKDMDRRTALAYYKEAVADCANLCWHVGNGNSLLCFLLFKRSLLQSNIGGDGGKNSAILSLRDRSNQYCFRHSPLQASWRPRRPDDISRPTHYQRTFRGSVNIYTNSEKAVCRCFQH